MGLLFCNPKMKRESKLMIKMKLKCSKLKKQSDKEIWHSVKLKKKPKLKIMSSHNNSFKKRRKIYNLISMAQILNSKLLSISKMKLRKSK